MSADDHDLVGPGRAASIARFYDQVLNAPSTTESGEQGTLGRVKIGRNQSLIFRETEEPLNAYDAEGHAALAAALDTPIATGEMLTSVAEHAELIRQRAADVLQPDAPRVGGITPFLKIMALADQQHLSLAPHFAMEIHLHLAAAYPEEPWLEHFEWLGPLFNEQLQLKGGRMWVPDRPGLGFTLSEQALRWTAETAEFGQRP